MARQPISKIRKIYMLRLIGRCIVFALCTALLIKKPEEYDILQGMNFFAGFSPLHLLWAVWIIDMLAQLFPIEKHISLGSMKLFRQRFQPVSETIDRQALKRYIISTTRAAILVMVLWCALIAAIGCMHHAGLLTDTMLFMIAIVFYICDLICVLIWCPFRLMMKTRCCTTCRIFNWDHLMMFSPLVFIRGFYPLSLFAMSLIVFIVWECSIWVHPEHFFEHSNAALQCANCTDKLCTQYCRKRRR